MRLRNTGQAWGGVAKVLHWSMAAGVLGMMALGWYAQGLPTSPTKLQLFAWHKSLGILLLALLVVRLAWRLANPVPQSPAGVPVWQRRAAALSHGLLYALMVAVPVSGWVIHSAANFPLKVFGLFRLPHLVGPSKAVQQAGEAVHLALFWVLAAVVLIHVLAALYHHFWLRDAVLRRMLPGPPEPSP
jgi:cytochrome b561